MGELLMRAFWTNFGFTVIAFIVGWFTGRKQHEAAVDNKAAAWVFALAWLVVFGVYVAVSVAAHLLGANRETEELVAVLCPILAGAAFTHHRLSAMRSKPS